MYYTLILAFIVSGAVVRDINLLFVLAGMMIGPLLLNWRMVVLALRHADVERRLPSQVFAGRPFRVEIRATNGRRRVGSWMVVVEDAMQSEPAVGAGLGADQRVRVDVLLPFVAAGQRGAAAYVATLPHRGRYRFGPLRLSTRFPLGLVKASRRLRRFERLVVFPRLGRLSPSWMQLIDAERVGCHEMHCRRGPIDGDYYSLRPWRSGDSKRWIHWRTTAKLGELAVREFEQPHNRDVAIVLDLWQPAEPGPEDHGRAELAVSFVATVVNELARRGHSQILVALAAERRGWWSATASPRFARQTMERLAVVRPAHENRVAEVLGDVLPEVPLGSHVVVVSTRPARLDEVIQSEPFRLKSQRRRGLERVVWLDVSAPRVASMFQWEELETNA